ncbi:MAG: TonB-dependent receptor [Gemmatimonadota bacterium]|nr:TonB-dependent receptor [Gemmatimonadota bacterium]
MRFRLIGSALAALLVSFVSVAEVEAQNGTLTGVVASQSGNPLVAAEVNIIGPTSTGVLTDGQGRFRATVAPGSYQVSVALPGYGGETQSATVTSGGTTVVNFRLEIRAFQLEPVTVITSERAPVGAGGREIEQPSTVDVISGREIRGRLTPDLTKHLEGSAGVDIIPQGLQAANIVVRGFNNIFSGALHMLSDYRLAGVPSLRVNLMHFIPTTNEDLERMEVVLGPGSALYGPNTANGVVHMISRSPLTDQGTTVVLGGGLKEQDSPSAFQGAFRSAFLLGDDVGFKISGQYLSGEEWGFIDPVEEAGRVAVVADPAPCVADKEFRGLSTAQAQAACNRIGVRDFDIERYSLEARTDWRFAEDGGVVATYGRNSSSGVELTGLGAGQTKDWVSQFYQLRLNKDRFFAQGYLNTSDAGDSFLLRDGTVLADESSLWVGQAQHGFAVAEGRQDFTYGFDYFATRPDSKGTIYGSYENDDEINEWGVYVQSKTAVTPKVDVIGALRLDSHSILPDNVWSPRVAVVFKPDEENGIRLTYNRAFSTPTALNYFLDISGGVAPAPLGGLGYGTRAFGSGRGGWGLQNADGTLKGMRSPFTPAGLGGPTQLLPANTPTMWQLAVGVLQAQGAIDAPTAAFLASLNPSDSDISRNWLNPLTGEAGSVSSLVLPDVDPTRESVTQTFELGWTGRLAERVKIATDVYYTKKNDFVSPLLVQTPLLFLDQPSMQAYLTPFLGAPTATALSTGAAQIPLGVVGSDDSGGRGPELILSYRNVGEVDFWGGDIAMEVLLSDEFLLNLMYSHVTKDEFEIDDGTPITLNAPRNKGAIGLAYRGSENGVSASTRLRFTGSFTAASAGFVGDVDKYAIVDVTAGYEIPNTPATLQLTISNLFNADYQSYVGVPQIGRFSMLAVRYELF